MTEPERPPELYPVREARWDAERSQRALEGVHARVARGTRTTGRGVLVFGVAAAAAAIVVWFVRPVPSLVPGVEPVAQPAYHDEGKSLRFADGSAVQLLDASSEVEVASVLPTRVEVSLMRGRGHFSVTPNPQRTFVVHAAQVTIVVLGSAFTVVREPMRVHVSVERGRAEVTSGGETRVLSADEAAWFDDVEPVLKAEPTVEPVPAVEPVEAVEPEGAASAVAVARARFLDHARHRQYARAMEVIRQRPAVVRDTAEDLMLAADAARLSGDAAAAVSYLRRVAQRHPRDSRAPLAAFTLGRILLFELDRPAEAREAYALTRKLSAQGALAEDALAREVEAAARAGQGAVARALADEYLARYPNGQRRAQVQKLSGRP